MQQPSQPRAPGSCTVQNPLDFLRHRVSFLKTAAVAGFLVIGACIAMEAPAMAAPAPGAPAPLPIVGAAAALGMSRKLRSRIKIGG